MALLAAGFLLQSCTIARSAGTHLRPPGERWPNPIATEAWIDTVEVLDPRLGNNRQLAGSLALSIEKYTQAAGYFRATNRLPGPIAEGDYLLAFRFNSLSQERRVHPAFVPAMFLTLTLYAWVGGPVYEDIVSLTGSLAVRDIAGENLAETSASVEKKRTGSVYSGSVLDGSDLRSALIKELLDNACAELIARKDDGQ